MCDPKNTRRAQEYLRCGHTLPNHPCDHWSHKLQTCLANPYTKSMRNAYDVQDVHLDKCEFCRQGRDIDGASAYGKGWEAR